MPKRADETTSRRQGQTREGMSGGSPSANVRADGQKSQRRLSPRASQHQVTKPARCRGSGQCGDCVLKVHALIRGDRSCMRSVPLWESN
jgi:ferredoxin